MSIKIHYIIIMLQEMALMLPKHIQQGQDIQNIKQA